MSLQVYRPPTLRWQLSSQRRARERSGWPPLPVGVLVTVGTLVLGLGLGAALRVDRAVGRVLTREPTMSMRQLISEGRYQEAIVAAELELASQPLDPEANLIKGIGSFYSSVGERAADTKQPLLAAAIVALRRALLDPGIAAGEPAAHYTLGKAYFHKGRFHYDQAVRYLEQSRELGYVASDSDEYLGLAYSSLGDARGLEHFELALERRPSDLLHLKMASLYVDAGNHEAAVQHLWAAVEMTEDMGLELKSRFELGAAYRALARLSDAELQYQAIIALSPSSADAHFYLGEVYDSLEDPVRARAEWRRAFALDDGHQRASERLGR